ncbi:MAG TPA: exodeoxyribonuclease VII large subunit [Clostridiales bacterium]|nr:exodeoxyribonuclease VII large subunit [Candidatus Apopatosoma intestinale]HBO66395.1 exodeoxyribonuclease VII large subunit [Candidatus Apopatosoma intestinale]
MAEERQVFTVTALNEYIKMKLETDEALMRVFIRGEISNFTNHKSGHFYFTVKDETSRIAAVMFRSSASKLAFIPENGMKVIVGGRVSAYVRDGQYQIYVDTLEPDGVGALYIAYEQLKAKLGAEGLFDEAKKKPLPRYPMRIGVITSPTGAAIRDIINILGRRFPIAEVVLYPSLVQGESAAPQLIEGLRYFNEKKNVNVIIIGRGGGSLEDLWAFNSEALVREVAASELPVISAVGHEIDFTLCDFAADRRAPTPSAAAELAVPERYELKRKLGNVTARLELLEGKKLELLRSTLERMKKSRALTDPRNFIDDKRMALGIAEDKLYNRITFLLERKKSALAGKTAKLDAMNPLSVLSRGYGAAFASDGTVIRSAAQVEKGSDISLMLSDGTVRATVCDIVMNEKEKI